MTARCRRCNQFLPLLGVHRCPCWEYNREPQPTRIGRWATWLAASSLAFVVLLAVAANATPRERPDAEGSGAAPTSLGAPQNVAANATRPETSEPVYPGADYSATSLVPGASLTPPSLPAATASPQPTSALVSMPVPTPPETDTDPTVRGTASHMGDSPDAGPRYLALPIGPGHRVRLCGAMGCLVVTSNDAGPALFMQRRGRVADLSWELFERLTGLDRSRGLAPISWRELE